MMNLNNKGKHIELLIHDYLKGAISVEDKDELFRWICQDPANVTFFNQVSDIWLSTSVFQDTEDFNPDEAFNRVKARIGVANSLPIEQKARVIPRIWFRVAAVLLPLILLGGLAIELLNTYKENNGFIGGNSVYAFEVPYGSKSTVTLPDGSQVILNSGSKLKFSEGFGKTHRVLNLVGEGYFKVAKNRHLAFVVHAGKLDVKALGTEFNVKAYPEDKTVETVLVHGSIEVTKKTERGKSLVLQPKQLLVYKENTDSIKVSMVQTDRSTRKSESVKVQVPAVVPPNVVYAVTKVDPVIYTTWKEGSWKIQGKDLMDLAVELERKYDVKVHFSSEALKQIKFSGTLRDESIEQVLAAIRLAAPIEYKVKGKIVELGENKNLMREYKQFYKNP